MTQICHVLEVMHKFHVGYFIELKNIYVVDGVIKIKNFSSSFSMSCWDETKEKEKNVFKRYLMDNYKDYVNVCGYSTADNSKEKV